MAIRIVDTEDTFRLIADDGGRYAVVEARAGHVYSLDPHHSREAPDSTDGMMAVIGQDGWHDEETARRFYEAAIAQGQHLSRVIW